MEAIKNFFKKAWDAIKAFAKKVWAALKNAYKAVVTFFKNVPWTKTVKPVIAYSVSGGTLVLAILIAVLVFALV